MNRQPVPREAVDEHMIVCLLSAPLALKWAGSGFHKWKWKLLKVFLDTDTIMSSKFSVFDELTLKAWTAPTRSLFRGSSLTHYHQGICSKAQRSHSSSFKSSSFWFMEATRTGFGISPSWVQIMTLPFTGCWPWEVTQRQCQFPHQKMEIVILNYSSVIKSRWDKMLRVQHGIWHIVRYTLLNVDHLLGTCR